MKPERFLKALESRHAKLVLEDGTVVYARFFLEAYSGPLMMPGKVREIRIRLCDIRIAVVDDGSPEEAPN